VYVAGFWDDAVNVFRRDEATGGLTFVEFHQDGVAGVDGLNAAQSIALSPDGDFVYVTGRDDDGLAVFGRNSETGQLTFVESIHDGADGVDGLAGIHSVTVSPDGRHLYTASLIDDAVAVFDRDKATGHLTYVEMLKDNVNGVDGLDQASSVIP
jgi:6-phosphogluconolactonase (cycloisomerase 2 family)